MNADLIPAGTVEEWQGGKLHKFHWKDHEVWLVEPSDPAPGDPWIWLPEWPGAFPERNGARDMIAHGYWMLHINVYGLYANETALSLMHELYEFSRQIGLAKKAALIGMSLGGLYSFRYAERYPETVACIYADAPVCDLHYRADMRRADAQRIADAYGLCDSDGLVNSPASPVNAMDRMAAAGIPVLMILGNQDTVVNPETNGVLFAERYERKGGSVTMIRRNCWGHHPHGLDDPQKIVNFILRHTLNKQF